MPDSLLQEGISKGNHTLADFLKHESEPKTPGRNLDSRLQVYWRTLSMDCTGYPMRRFNDADITPLQADFEKWWLTLNPFRNIHGDTNANLSGALRATFGHWTFAITSTGLLLYGP